MLIPLEQFALIRFSGSDARAFLHGQLTCDVAGLPPGRSTYGGYCSPKGRVLATFLLWSSGEDLYLQLPALLRDPVRKQISKYILRAKVGVADASGEWSLAGVAGPDARNVVERVVGDVPRQAHAVLHTPAATAIGLPGDRHLLVVARNEAAVLESLSPTAERRGPEYWDWLDIRSGIPVILPATQEAFVPQMLNLDLIGGVSFEKGCYPGQEIVARMHYRGTLKQRMYLAHINGRDPPRPGDRLYSPDFGRQASGTVVNAAASPDGGYDLLASVQIASAGRGELRWGAPDGPAVTLLELPYLSGRAAA
jgi:folate-binding protein YgfZ